MKPRGSTLNKVDEGEEEASKGDDGFQTVQKSTTTASATIPGKYVPPSQRKSMQEEEDNREREKEYRPSRRQQEPEPVRRQPVQRAGTTGGSGDGYVPPAVKKQREADAWRKEEEESKAKEKAEKADHEKEVRKRLEKERKEKEDSAKREKADKKKEAKEVSKEAAKAEAETRTKPKKENRGAGGLNEDKLSAFGQECTKLLQGSAQPKVDKLTGMLGQAEFNSIQPTSLLMDPVLRHCRGKEDKEVLQTVQRVAPLLESLIDKADARRFKVKVLCETQRLASSMGLPRLSPTSALLEVVFDGLYQSEVIEEQYFEWWAIADDETPGKMSAMFQVDPFLDFIRHGHFEGDESSEEEAKVKGEDDDDEEEEEDDDGSDIEANVPKRIGVR